LKEVAVDGFIIETVDLPMGVLNLLLLVLAARKVALTLKKPMVAAKRVHSEEN